MKSKLDKPENMLHATSVLFQMTVDWGVVRKGLPAESHEPLKNPKIKLGENYKENGNIHSFIDNTDTIEEAMRTRPQSGKEKPIGKISSELHESIKQAVKAAAETAHRKILQELVEEVLKAMFAGGLEVSNTGITDYFSNLLSTW